MRNVIKRMKENLLEENMIEERTLLMWKTLMSKKKICVFIGTGCNSTTCQPEIESFSGSGYKKKKNNNSMVDFEKSGR